MLRALFDRQLRANDLRVFWQRLTHPADFQDTQDEFQPTRLVSRAEEMIDGHAVQIGEGLEVSEEDLRTLPAELQDEFAKQSRSGPLTRHVKTDDLRR